MYKWYWNAELCYAYLSDVPEELFRKSKWFTRGWTLQELLAPSVVEFYRAEWTLIGTKVGLVDRIQAATDIDKKYLLDRTTIQSATIGKKFSWTESRVTTRPEDVAYCLLGLVKINMPLLYGEGSRAFYRLQLEILTVSHDHTIFVWQLPQHTLARMKQEQLQGLGDGFCGMLASSPDHFSIHRELGIESRTCRNDVRLVTHEMTNIGLRITLPCTDESKDDIVYAFLNCRIPNDRWVALQFQKRTGGRYKRCACVPIQYYPKEKVREARLVEMLVKAERSVIESRSRDGGGCRLRVRRVRLWDSPQELAELDWLKTAHHGGDLLGKAFEKTTTRPIIPHDFNDGCVVYNGEIGALRLRFGATTGLVALSLQRHQACLALLQSRQDAHLALAQIGEQFRSNSNEYHRDYLEAEEDGMTFAISAKKQLRSGVPCWLLTMEIWSTALGRPDQNSTIRPYVDIERHADGCDVPEAASGPGGVKITRRRWHSQTLGEETVSQKR
jgi:hypothetical protein